MPDYPGPEQLAEAEEQHEGQRPEGESWVQVNREQPPELNSGTYLLSGVVPLYSSFGRYSNTVAVNRWLFICCLVYRTGGQQRGVWSLSND